MSGSGVPRRESIKGLIVLVITAILWSTSGIAIKLITWHPIAIAGTRSLVAVVMLTIVSRSVHPPKNIFGYLAAAGYTGAMVTFVMANKLTTSANAIFLQYLFPAFVAILGMVVLGDRPKKSDWYILVGLLAGMVIFFLDRLGAGGITGNILAVVSGLFMAAFIVFMKKDTQSDAVGIMLYGHLFSVIVSVPFIFTSGFPDIQGVIGIAYLGIVQIGLTSLLFAYALRRLSALGTAVVSLVEPVMNPVWVFLIISEVPSVYAIIGGSLIIGLVALRSVIAMKRPRKLPDHEVT